MIVRPDDLDALVDAEAAPVVLSVHLRTGPRDAATMSPLPGCLMAPRNGSCPVLRHAGEVRLGVERLALRDFLPRAQDSRPAVPGALSAEGVVDEGGLRSSAVLTPIHLGGVRRLESAGGIAATARR